MHHYSNCQVFKFYQLETWKNIKRNVKTYSIRLLRFSKKDRKKIKKHEIYCKEVSPTTILTVIVFKFYVLETLKFSYSRLFNFNKER